MERCVARLICGICPVIVGGSKRLFLDGVRMNLELVEQRRFDNGAVVLRYEVSDREAAWRP